MSRIFEYTEKPFAGKVTFHDPLTLPMVSAIEEKLIERDEFFTEVETDEGKVRRVLKLGAGSGKLYQAIIETALPCVEAWELTGMPDVITPETFPGSPRTASRSLCLWLLNRMLDIYNGETAVPNE